MYFDDTDLIHWSRIPICILEELIAAAQTATYTWGGLAIETGATMKPENVMLTSSCTGSTKAEQR
jgi:hypothetical protein